MRPLGHLDLKMHASREVTEAHMRAAFSRDLPPFVGHAERHGAALIVGNGPSLWRAIPNIRAKARKGAKVIATQGADSVLINAGIVPNWVALLDPLEMLAEMVSPHPSVAYLVASCCHPAVFDKLAGYDVRLWHANNDRDEQRLLEAEYGHRPWILISGGATVGLRAINLGYILGYRRFHMYGVDSSLSRDGRMHANRTPNEIEAADRPFNIICAGREFVAPAGLARQAQDFVRLMRETFAGKIDIRVHGDGLLPHICRTMRRAGECQFQQQKEAT